MKPCYLLALLSYVSTLVSALSSDIEFLKSFFEEKNVEFTISGCWNRDKIRLLAREMVRFPKFQQMGFYSNFNDVNVMKQRSNNHFLVVDFRNCDRSYLILNQLNLSNIFAHPLKYLFLVDTLEFQNFADKLEKCQILPNCEVVIAVFDNEFVSLSQPYKVGKINELTWEKYGNWSSGGNLVEYNKNIPTSQRRMNLKRANIVVCLVIFENDTLNHLSDYIFPGIDTFTKQDFEPSICMLEHMNVNYSFSHVDNYGYVDEKTGIFSGLVREIQTGRADVSGGSIFFTEERYAVVDLLKQGNPHPIRFVVKKPSTSFIKNIFFITFTTSVWIACIVILVIFAMVVIVILNWETNHKEKVKQNKYSVSDVTLVALEAVCQQGTATEPQSFAGRILALILFGAFMFIYVSYSANIVVLLQSTTKINDIQELLESRIEVGGCKIHYMKNYFESVKKGPLRQLYLEKIYPDQYFPLEIGMKMVQEGNFAFHVALQSAYDYILQHFTNYEICGLQQLPGYIEESLGYIAVPKRSPYKDLFKVALLKVDEYGLQRRTNLRVFRAPKCFSEGGTFKSVGFYDCAQVLWIWIGGTALSILFFVIEKCIRYFSKGIEIKKKFNFDRIRIKRF